jgi:putative glutamine amidotransferase
MKAIEQAGGIPLILSYLEEEKAIKKIAQKLDGLYLTGGNDIDPIYFGEEPHPNLGFFHPGRDAFEIKMAQLFLQLNKPILGVCKGSQMLNLAAGGSMYQDTPSQMEGELIQHTQIARHNVPTHEVEIVEGSLLHRIVGEKKIRVNSFHHQSNRDPGEDLMFSGVAQDGVVEAVESKVHPFALGLQWHPETMAVKSHDETSQRIFTEFIEACKRDKEK